MNAAMRGQMKLNEFGRPMPKGRRYLTAAALLALGGYVVRQDIKQSYRKAINVQNDAEGRSSVWQALKRFGGNIAWADAAKTGDVQPRDLELEGYL